jgi:hypothetical protein
MQSIQVIDQRHNAATDISLRVIAQINKIPAHHELAIPPPDRHVAGDMALDLLTPVVSL